MNMTVETLARDTFMQRTISGHGYWLVNHADIIEDQVAALIKVHGEQKALELISDHGSKAHDNIYKTIEHVRNAVQAAEHNEKHEDDYFNAGGFFAHWEQYTQGEKLEFISKALEELR